ncbi:hypothetical protein TPHV1_40200 [Treponema phagedenis]|uniref:Uncharacterized protein n=1 Tax=Treponema phagedenis TaxID=162 RepID=A0A0B7GYH8_TREPH|nr:hypothetical protein TPHV1_40200 [Treponema phagedenis]
MLADLFIPEVGSLFCIFIACVVSVKRVYTTADKNFYGRYSVFMKIIV